MLGETLPTARGIVWSSLSSIGCWQRVRKARWEARRCSIPGRSHVSLGVLLLVQLQKLMSRLLLQISLNGMGRVFVFISIPSNFLSVVGEVSFSQDTLYIKENIKRSKIFSNLTTSL